MGPDCYPSAQPRGHSGRPDLYARDAWKRSVVQVQGDCSQGGETAGNSKRARKGEIKTVRFHMLLPEVNRRFFNLPMCSLWRSAFSLASACEESLTSSHVLTGRASSLSLLEEETPCRVSPGGGAEHKLPGVGMGEQ